jgi:hypothetical protein
VPLIGRVTMTILDVEHAPGAMPTIVGRQAGDLSPLSIPIPQRTAGGCWSAPRADAQPRPR